MNGAARIRMHQSKQTIMIKIEQCNYTKPIVLIYLEMGTK